MPRGNILDQERLLKLFRGGCSLGEIADQMNIHTATARRNLVRLGAVQQRSAPAKSFREIQKPIVVAGPDSEPQPYVDRDPCGFCGVRGDIGCQHNRRVA